MYIKIYAALRYSFLHHLFTVHSAIMQAVLFSKKKIYKTALLVRHISNVSRTREYTGVCVCVYNVISRVWPYLGKYK